MYKFSLCKTGLKVTNLVFFTFNDNKCIVFFYDKFEEKGKNERERVRKGEQDKE